MEFCLNAMKDFDSKHSHSRLIYQYRIWLLGNYCLFIWFISALMLFQPVVSLYGGYRDMGWTLVLLNHFGIGVLLGLHSLSGRTSTRRSRKVSQPRYSGLDFSNRSEIWQAPRQQRRRDDWQVSERYGQNDIQSRGFETPRALAVSCPSA